MRIASVKANLYLSQVTQSIRISSMMHATNIDKYCNEEQIQMLKSQ